MTTASPKRWLDPPLPGGPDAAVKRARFLRVDHAGEVGAVRIYQGQLAVLGQSPRTKESARLIGEMAAQEARHLETFDALLAREEVRPTALRPLWDIAGFALGAATALLGEKAAMACTVAVEEAIDEHYARQARALKDSDPKLHDTIEEFRRDENEHRARARDAGAEQMPAYKLLSAAIKASCRLAIKLSEKY